MKYGSEVVGSAAVALEVPEVGVDPESPVKVHIRVSANGKVPLTDGATGNYYTGDVEAVHSVITTVFLEIMP